MPGNFFKSDGTPSNYPTTREDAQRLNYKRYDGDKRCGKCRRIKRTAYVRYTKNDACVMCCERLSIDTYNAIAAGMRKGERSARDATLKGLDSYNAPLPCNVYGHIGQRTLLNRCYECEEINAAPTPRQAAIDKGQTQYIPTTKCRNGHLTARRISGQCIECLDANKPASTPRQAAIDKGQTQYIPTTKCRNGHLTARHVSGKCTECHSRPKRILIQDAQPDLVIDRRTAKGLGWKVYRTGEECRRGHKAYRYISTKGCIRCKHEN